MEADFADKHDSRSLIGVVDPLVRGLKRQGLEVSNILADAGYSSGDNYADMELRGLNAYIPPHGTFKGGPDDFVYEEKGDYYECRNGKRTIFRKIRAEKGTDKRQHATRRSDCRGCPFKEDCRGKGTEKRFTVVNHLKEYRRAIDRVNSRKGQYMKRRRHATVEPVFLMAAIAYNLKKYLKFEKRRPPHRKRSSAF